ncbi:uncharacterized protein LOC117345084 [Pecten maximus]|uniref:uncharacterized protein LOC117345084 n=1 Tax=Pecten maximus TaxID=6579 RepID=UPI001458193D|nr:uncharacterized protein LOC117345084 [Pecten maximus]
MSGKFPGCSDSAWPEVFTEPAMPCPSTVKKSGQLADHVIRKFFEDGFVIVEDFFTPEELNPCKEDIADVVDEVANMLWKKGKIKDLYNDFGFHERLVRMNDDFPGANILVIKTGRVPKALKQLWANERLLNVIEQLIGPNIAGNPVWNIRAKIPSDEDTTVPWHQDCAYLDNDTYNMLIPTAWIPFVDTNFENGCMEFVKGGHRLGKVATHQCCHGGTWYTILEEEEMTRTLGVDLSKDREVVPVPFGGMVLFSNMIPHRSLPNNTSHIRWTVDLRWQHPDSPSGLWGLKEKVLMRSSDNPDLEIDWETFDAVDRCEQQKTLVTGYGEEADDPELDTTITGPWMKQWEIVHMNRHVKV